MKKQLLLTIMVGYATLLPSGIHACPGLSTQDLLKEAIIENVEYLVYREKLILKNLYLFSQPRSNKGFIALATKISIDKYRRAWQEYTENLQKYNALREDIDGLTESELTVDPSLYHYECIKSFMQFPDMSHKNNLDEFKQWIKTVEEEMANKKAATATLVA